MGFRDLQLLIPLWNLYYALKLGLEWHGDLRRVELNASEDETIITSYAVQRDRALASGNFDAAEEFDRRIADLGRRYIRLI